MRILILLAILTAGFCSATSDIHAQEIKKAWNDYFGERPLTYSPTDPWVRSNTFNKHTGHSGVYYNCDGEEEKRNSPYICWKPHFEADFPECRGLGAQLKQDWNRMRQRICDGAGDCCNGCKTEQSCQCADCTGGATQQPSAIYDTVPTDQPSCQCAECLAKRGAIVAPPTPLTSQRPTTPQRPIASQSLMTRLNSTNNRVANSVSGGHVVANHGAVAAVASKPSKATCDCAKCKLQRQSQQQSRTAQLRDSKVTTSRR